MDTISISYFPHEQQNQQGLLLHNLVENLSGMVYRVLSDENWTWVLCSHNSESITGYTKRDFIEGSLFTFAQIIHREDLEAVRQSVDKAVATDQPYVLEYRIRHADGSLRWVQDRGCAVYDEAGSACWLEGVVFDISERKMAEDLLAKRTNEAEAAAHAKNDLGVIQMS